MLVCMAVHLSTDFVVLALHFDRHICLDSPSILISFCLPFRTTIKLSSTSSIYKIINKADTSSRREFDEEEVVKVLCNGTKRSKKESSPQRSVTYVTYFMCIMYVV